MPATKSSPLLHQLLWQVLCSKFVWLSRLHFVAGVVVMERQFETDVHDQSSVAQGGGKLEVGG